jgi:subtilisin family serine protease
VGSNFGDPAKSFVIAKDLVGDMQGALRRTPVLIELSAEVEGTTLHDKRNLLAAELRKLTKDPAANVEPLKRYVAAHLTASEIMVLRGKHKNLAIRRLWRDSVKRAVLDKSTAVVHSQAAHESYAAYGEGINWATLDTGIRADHPHFKEYANVKAQWDCTKSGAPKAGGKDGDGHGTHVAGIIAGTGTENKVTYGGNAPRAGLHVYKVLSDDGSGQDSWIIKALDHIADLNENSPDLVIHGINLSLGGPFDPEVYGCGFSPLCNELRRLWRQGVLVCIAAGNEGRLVLRTLDGIHDLNLDLSIGDPANLEEAIAVGSVHKESPHLYGISYFSSRGPTADGRRKPDVVAPGEKIISANAGFETEDNYIAMSGTSMACPQVSGVLAAFLSVRREFIGRPDLVKQILVEHCVDLRRDANFQGAGVPNLMQMLLST